jgi:hypothetical protein
MKCGGRAGERFWSRRADGPAPLNERLSVADILPMQLSRNP